MVSQIEDELKPKSESRKIIEVLPLRVNGFDKLLADQGLERGSVNLLTGAVGTGKTTFCMQCLYTAALHDEKSVFISFEEEPDKIKTHMEKNYGWDFNSLEKKGLFSIIKLDPIQVAAEAEGVLAGKKGSLESLVNKLKFPFTPDRIVIDSLSDLRMCFKDKGFYWKYIKTLFDFLEEVNSVNLVVDETEHSPHLFSRNGPEEFLSDGVIVFYNIMNTSKRDTALEILKIRSGKHVKATVPFVISKDGFHIDASISMLLSLNKLND